MTTTQAGVSSKGATTNKLHYWKYIKPRIGSFIVGPILMISEVLGEILLPSLLADIIDIGVKNKDISFIVTTGITMAVLAIFMMISGVGGAFFASKASIGFAADLRKDLFGRVQDFTFANIDRFSTGSLVTRLTNDVTQMQQLINMALRMMLRSPGMLIGALIMAIRQNPSLSAILAVVIPLMAITIGFILFKSAPLFTGMQKKLDGLNASIRENITNVRVVKSFVREKHETARFDVANKDLQASTLKAMRLVISTMPIMTFAMNVTSVAVLWFGGNQVIMGEMQAGDLIAFTNYVTQILMSLIMVSMIFMNISRALASSKRIREVMETVPEISDTNAKHPDLEIKAGKIEFFGVSFRYYADREAKVLENISFVANPGETVGIIGSTGSGKSSLVQLIPRLYDPMEGSIQIDGVDVKDYSLTNLRQGIGMVLQKNLLFSGSLAENLSWGKKDATREELEQVAAVAAADEFINQMPEGYDAQIARGGQNVSGGQKQRLCIARALLKDPKILILDDSTSAVDTATEAKIRKAFGSTYGHATKLIIAQRISSVQDADRILVLDDGKIVGQGTHDQLLQTNEAYREIYESQKGSEVVGDGTV